MKLFAKLQKISQSTFFIYIPVVILCLIVAFPYLWTFINSITSSKDMFQLPLKYVPEKPTLGNYVFLIEKTPFLKAVYNSLFVAFFTTLIAGTLSTLAGYSFSRYKFKGRNKLLIGFLLLYLFPQVLLLIPLFTIFKEIGLLNTPWALIIAYSTNSVPFAIWLVTGYINQIPVELDEAAKIDNCNLLETIFYIILPIVRPGLAAASIYIFISAWNEFTYAAMFTNSISETITVRLMSYITSYNVRWDLITAGGCLAVIPIVIIFSFVQRNLVSGLAAGSVKG